MKRLNIVDEISLSKLTQPKDESFSEPTSGEWIKILRTALRMTQAELANRAKVTQPHLGRIEGGKIDPRTNTLRRIFQALSCDFVIMPRPKKDIKEVLRGRARSIALKRLKQAMGPMALEGQASEPEIFRQLLEKRTEEILNDSRERLWNKKDD